jgi:hypothetical protein
MHTPEHSVAKYQADFACTIIVINLLSKDRILSESIQTKDRSDILGLTGS